MCRWRTKIDPVLKDEESRSNFDIQMYAERIIGRLQQAAVPDMVCACVVVDALNMVCLCGCWCVQHDLHVWLWVCPAWCVLVWLLMR